MRSAQFEARLAAALAAEIAAAANARQPASLPPSELVRRAGGHSGERGRPGGTALLRSLGQSLPPETGSATPLSAKGCCS